ncbi:unnamed protein product, partial [Citrullus colocynthis]
LSPMPAHPQPPQAPQCLTHCLVHCPSPHPYACTANHTHAHAPLQEKPPRHQ